MEKHSVDRRSQRSEPGALLTKYGGITHEAISFPSGVHASPTLLDRLWLAKLSATSVVASYAKGSILFTDEQRAYGAYVILEGRVKLSVTSAHGKSLILAFFGPGAVLGLPGAILGWPYGATAEIVKPTRATLVARDDLLRHLRSDVKAAFQAAELLSDTCYSMLGQMKAISLSESVEQRLAAFLLGLCPAGKSPGGQTRLKLDLNQEDIAHMVGVSRETVARLFSRFKKRNILDPKRSALVVHDKAALERLAQFSKSDARRSTPVARLARKRVT